MRPALPRQEGRHSAPSPRLAILLLLGITSALSLSAQDNPVPFVNQPLVPTAVAPGGPGFTLTVNGTGFVSGATVNWNGSPRPTSFVSGSQLTAAIPATDIATIGSASITVVNPAPGGGNSNVVFLPVRLPQTSVTLVTSFLAGAHIVAAADFNADGKMDIATLTASCAECPVVLGTLLGNGDGTFQTLPPAGDLQSGYLGSPPVVADLNADGKPDLIFGLNISSPGSASLAVLLGDGDGTFLALSKVPVGFRMSERILGAVGDFDEDGKLDLAIPNSTDGGVAILLGNGDGTFGSPAFFGATGGAHVPLVCEGDFNGDGKLDLAYATFDSGSMNILLGNGEGTFQPSLSYAVPGDLVTLVAADLSDDGELDLAAVGGYPWSEEVHVLVGNGDGTFQGAAVYAAPRSAGPLLVGDFNGDGKVDLALSYFPPIGGGYLVEFLYGREDGTFEFEAVGHNSLDNISADLAAVVDFNGDGKLDLVANLLGAAALVQESSPTLSPANVVFPDQSVGAASAAQEVRLTNFSGSTLTIDSVEITGANAADFAQTNTCGTSVASGSYCVFSITFTPGDLGARTGTLSVSDSDPTSPQIATLSGNGIAPTAVPSVASLEFGSQPVNTTSAPQTLSLSNTGLGALTIGSIATSSDFGQTNTCGTSLAEGATCTINVTFTPSEAWARVGTLTINDNATNSPQIISLTGLGIPPAVTLSTTNLTFGSVAISTSSPSQLVMLYNNGPGPLTVSGISTSGDFSETNNCLGTLGALESCAITVTFTPTAGGTHTGTVTINDNAVANPQAVSLSGTGIPPTVSISPTTMDFGDERVGATSGAQAVTVTNTGGGPLTLSSVTASGDYAQTNNCGGTLAASGSCTINVTFKPALRGTRTGTLTINDNGVGNPHTVSLTGNGIAPGVALSPTALNFLDQSVGVTSPPLNVTLTNSGNTTLNIAEVLATPPFAVAGSTCGATLAASASCTLSVNFTASVAGTTYGALILSNNAPDSPQTLSLTGTTAVNFPDQPVGLAGAPQTVTLANMSGTARVISGITTTGDFAASGGCATVTGGGSCALSVTFTPAAAGTRTGSLLVADNAPGSPHVMTLRGIGLGPGVSFSAATVNFASVVMGATSAAQTVTITNSGNQELSITGISLTGTNSGDFGLTNGCGASLAATASCTASVTFTPAATGARSASLIVADNASGNPHTVALTGTGTDFTLGTQTGGSMSATVAAGGTAAFNLQLAPTGFTGDVALTCAFQGSTPRGASCSVSPNSVTANGVDPAPFAVNVATTARAMAAPQVGDYKSPLQRAPEFGDIFLRQGKLRSPLQGLLALLMMLMLLVVAPPFRTAYAGPARSGTGATRLALAATLLAVLLWASCGRDIVMFPPQTGTPAGIYNLTVTATAGGVSKTSTLTLTVN